MLIWFKLAYFSAKNRASTLLLSILAIAVSAMLLLGITRISEQTQNQFTLSVSGTDLIVGPRDNSVSLLLSSVFHLGKPTQTMSWASAEAIKNRPEVKWSIPLSIGDNYQGYPVVGTTSDFYQYFRYGDQQPLVLAQGSASKGIFDVVIGAQVAQKRHLKLGDKIVLSHGTQEKVGHTDHEEAGHEDHDHAKHEEHEGHDHAKHEEHGEHEGHDHADKPFVVTGILAPTNTPVDQTVYIELAGMSAIHLDWQAGAPIKGVQIPAEFVKKFNLTPTEINSVLVGLHDRSRVLDVQRSINDQTDVALSAVLPGVALNELWGMLSTIETMLLAISTLAAFACFVGLIAVILSSLGERRRELAILRSVGAKPRHIFALLFIEGCSITFLGIAFGLLLLILGSTLAAPLINDRLGFTLTLTAPSLAEWRLMAMLMLGGALASIIPGLRAYRYSLNDGLTPSA
jgi:putative ABC transport system permease protein